MLMHAKNYYLAPAYPMLLAAGGAAFEGWIAALADGSRRLAAKIVVFATVLIPGAITAPVVLPVLSPDRHVAYVKWLGLEPSKTEVAHVGPLPQLFGDQFGWPELIEEIAAIYNAMPEEEKSRTGIFANNYGEAGAINLFGPEHGLPPAICAHQTHSMWGLGDFAGDQLIWLQWQPEWLEDRCTSVEIVGSHHHPWGMAEENRPISLCRGPTPSLAEQWPDLRNWN
jgi:hypothetical protein